MLLGLSMPVMDGYEALRRIRQDPPVCIVVVLSAVTAAHASLKALQFGAHGYIQKGGGVPALMSQ